MQDKVLIRLKEREKELNCLYKVEELLKDENAGINYIFRRLLEIIPSAWQYSTVCMVRINYLDLEIKSEFFIESEWKQTAEIIVDNNICGKIDVFYSQFIRFHQHNSQFLQEEQKLLNTIANRVSDFIFHKKLKETLEYLNSPENKPKPDDLLSNQSDAHWKWRFNIVKNIAEKCDFNKFGIEAFYLIGSTKEANAGPASDIDLLIHFSGNDLQKNAFYNWIDGWGLCLDEMNFLKSGYRSNSSLIDLHIITDEDIQQKTSYAVMIGSAYNSARLIRKKE